MRRLGESAGALRRSERGFTLIELLVATTIGMVVLGGAVTVFMGAVRSEPRTASQVSALQEARVAVERITREVRQGMYVVTAGPSDLALVTYVRPGSCGTAGGAAEPCRVIYDCAADACTRAVAEPDGDAPSAPIEVVSGLASTAVFQYSPSGPEAEPSYVDVRLSFATNEGGPVVVADGAALRNTES
ncbi:MAG TPA: prepilin-type N-terminal cleavage/methylation domain-containing protein [Solirubrobacterales bacterium]|nr:prepilin-type N-terminal cleavage/methylation domain-containing protein [Solirubrobacterales bacterium]